MAKIQIDNSLDLGWKREDIMMVTNFPYEYNGVKAMVIEEDVFCPFYKFISKINTILELYKKGVIERDMVYWYHDFDSYQNNLFTEEELGLDGVDVGWTDYGRISRWSGGNFFFKYNTRDIFGWIRDDVYKIAETIKPQDEFFDYSKFSEELSLERMTDKNFNNINSRIKRLNITYNFGMRTVYTNYTNAIKPIRILHFHPYNKILNTLAIAMYGKNSLKKPLMEERLIKVFQAHGVV